MGSWGRKAAFIFARSGTSWTQEAQLTADEGRSNLGRDVALQGDLALVGAWEDRVGANDRQGAAYVLKRTGTGWQEQAQLTVDEGAAFDRLASSAAMDGDVALLGAPARDVRSRSNQGLPTSSTWGLR